jgi:hypothetical protein
MFPLGFARSHRCYGPFGVITNMRGCVPVDREVKRLWDLSGMPRPLFNSGGARTTERQTALLQRGGTSAVPLLVEHFHISDLGGQRLVSVIQYTIVELL